MSGRRRAPIGTATRSSRRVCTRCRYNSWTRSCGCVQPTTLSPHLGSLSGGHSPTSPYDRYTAHGHYASPAGRTAHWYFNLLRPTWTGKRPNIEIARSQPDSFLKSNMQILSFSVDSTLRGKDAQDYAVRFSINLQPPGPLPRIVNTFPPVQVSRPRGNVFTLPWIGRSPSRGSPVHHRVKFASTIFRFARARRWSSETGGGSLRITISSDGAMRPERRQLSADSTY